jgi:hypothetical protein
VAVIGITGQGLHSSDEPAARGATRDPGLYPERSAPPRLALGDTFQLGRMQRAEPVGAVRLSVCVLDEFFATCSPTDRKSRLAFYVDSNLAAGLAFEPAEQLRKWQLRRSVCLCPRAWTGCATARQAWRPTRKKKQLRQLDPVLSGQRVQPRDIGDQ